MADQDLEGSPQGDELRAQVASILELKARAETATASAEEASRKANSESGFAFNAKQNAEDHAKAIAQVRGSVEADFNWLNTTKSNISAVVEAIDAAKQTSESSARSIIEARGASDVAAAAIRAAQERGEAALSSLEKARDDAGLSSRRVTDDAETVAVARARCEAATAAIQALQTQASELSSKAQADAAASAQSSEQSAKVLASMSSSADVAAATTTRVVAYEEELTRLRADFGALHSKIESLLPGATSAGLASAFRDQKARFERPQKIWFWTFVATLVALFIVGSFSVIERIYDPINQPLTWDLIRLRIVYRLPLAVPLIWLALYAGRNYMLALRLQEDYAYKEAISTAFEGYRREMANMPVSADQLVPVLSLCENVLTTLGQRPGRLYDGKHEDVTPLTPFRSLLGGLGSKGSGTRGETES